MVIRFINHCSVVRFGPSKDKIDEQRQRQRQHEDEDDNNEIDERIMDCLVSHFPRPNFCASLVRHDGSRRDLA